mgnify:FL=1
MTHLRSMLHNECLYCGPHQEELRTLARENLRADVTVQNEKEAEYSIRKLCSIIRKEGNGAPLTHAQRARYVCGIKKLAEPGHVEVCAPKSHTPYYTGKISQYWKTLLSADLQASRDEDI